MAVNREVAVVIYQKVRGGWAREVGGPKHSCSIGGHLLK